MSFRMNSYQQLSLTDSFSGLTSREQKALEHSWAKSFAEDIFPSIEEEPFKVVTMPPVAAQMMMKAVLFLLSVPISRKL